MVEVWPFPGLSLNFSASTAASRRAVVAPSAAVGAYREQMRASALVSPVYAILQLLTIACAESPIKVIRESSGVAVKILCGLEETMRFTDK